MQRYDANFLYRDYKHKAHTPDGILARMNERLDRVKEQQKHKPGKVAQMRRCR